ncbi:gamma-glutamyl-gamma-aminobutyrate hydrolase family protein [Lachnospiraceae bacterium 54-53]
MTKPVIGVIGNTLMTELGRFHSMERTYANSSYMEAVLRNGGVPVIIPAASILNDPRQAMRFCDGLIFPGGEDIHPWYYGQEPVALTGELHPEIDEALGLAGKYALDRRIPMLGICKGHQFLNVLMGGTLYQDISLRGQESIQHMQKRKRSCLTHHVEISEGTRLAGILGPGTRETNSMHHQAVKELGKGLKVSAFASDGVIEALEDDDGLIIGVQWHPEDLIDSAPVMNRLFACFGEQCVRMRIK